MDEQCGKSTNHIALPFDVPLIGFVYRAIQVITFFSSIRKKITIRLLYRYIYIYKYHIESNNKKKYYNT
jgi:hypothetical protein